MRFLFRFHIWTTLNEVSWLEVFLETLRRMFFPPFSNLAVRPAVSLSSSGNVFISIYTQILWRASAGVGFCNVEPEPSADSSFCKEPTDWITCFQDWQDAGMWAYLLPLVTYLLFYDPSLNRLTAQLRDLSYSYYFSSIQVLYWSKCKGKLSVDPEASY